MNLSLPILPPELPLPAFAAPDLLTKHNVWGWSPDLAETAEAALAFRAQHDIKPEATDRDAIRLLIIDQQHDFAFPEGTLYVGGRSGRGAMEDSERIVRFMMRNMRRISRVTCTFDTHLAYHIFSASFWQDADGKPLQAYRTITLDDVKSGRVRPVPAMAAWLCGGNYTWLRDQVQYYCEQLAQSQGHYELFLWPYHCILGTPGHALVGIVQQARWFHSMARVSQSASEVKGTLPLSEYYSVLRPEVLGRHDKGALAQKNTAFIETLLTSKVVIIAGEAASHCVRFTISDLGQEILAHDPALAQRVYILRDCTSSVVVPGGMDYTDQANEALDKFAAQGMHVVNSTDDMESWPGLRALLA